MEIKPLPKTIKALLIAGGLVTGWIANEYLPFTKEQTEVQAPQAQHQVHYAQLGVPEAESFSSVNSLQGQFYKDGDHYEYPLTFLCGCTFTLSQWAIADTDNAELEGKIFRVIHTPLTFWNKRLYFLKEEVDAEGKPLPKPTTPESNGY